MVNVSEILDLKEYFVNTLYSTLRKYQREEQDYYEDKFDVPQIKEPMRKARTGRAARLVDRPVEHIVTSNPQVLVEEIHKVDDKNKKILPMLNRVWMPALKRQNPNPFKESIRKCLLRGESWLQLSHNPTWNVSVGEDKDGKPIFNKQGLLPVWFLSPDPIIVFADPEEYEGIPKRVIVWCERMPALVKNAYPEWSNPEGKEKNQLVNWLAYYDNKSRYFEADGQAVGGGIQPNIYGFPPFIHATSGFGCQTALGEPSDLIVGRLRKCQDLLVRDSAIASSIDGIIYLMGQPQHMFECVVDQQYPDDMLEGKEFGLGKAILLPYGVKHVDYLGMQPTPQMFQWYENIQRALEWEDPRVLVGLPEGTSGRQQEMTATSAMTRYEALVENVEAQFTTGVNKALQMIKKIPGLLPEGISGDDITDGYYVQLKAEDEASDERRATLGSRLYQNPKQEIDLMTNLVKYQGKTVEEAREIVTNIMVDMVTFQNPEWAAIAGQAAADEMGMEKYLQSIRERGQSAVNQQQGLQQPSSPSAMQRATGEVMTPMGREMIDEALRSKGGRRPPQAYVRGGQ